jgi:hypothetical protein
MIKFRTESYSNEIKKIEIIKETDKSIIYNNGRREVRELKNTSYSNYFDSFERAKYFLIETVTNKIISSKEEIKRLELRLDKIYKSEEKECK